jgi:hypothetical protein
MSVFDNPVVIPALFGNRGLGCWCVGFNRQHLDRAAASRAAGTRREEDCPNSSSCMQTSSTKVRAGRSMRCSTRLNTPARSYQSMFCSVAFVLRLLDRGDRERGTSDRDHPQDLFRAESHAIEDSVPGEQAQRSPERIQQHVPAVHRVNRDERLGASHVHHWHAIPGHRLFRVDGDGDCGADGDQDLNWLATMWAARSTSWRRSASATHLRASRQNGIDVSEPAPRGS